MTARDTIADAIFAGHETFKATDRSGAPLLLSFVQADAVIEAVRGMPRDELTELRPDIATEYHAHLDTAATRGQYLLTRLRAHTTTQEAS